MSFKKIIVGTRASKLALYQCYQAVADIQETSKSEFNELIDSEFKLIVTSGDAAQGTPQASQVTKKAWIDKIEEALLDESIDVAIHSGKDIPKDIAEGTKLIPIGKRSSPFDIFVGKRSGSKRLRFADLGENSIIGTASLRRKLFLQKYSASLNIIPHRGNVTTRIDKLDKSKELDGIILAAAGLRRLNIDCEYEELDSDLIVPAALQGILVAQIRISDSDTETIINRTVNEITKKCFIVERRLSEALGADCKSCVGIYATLTSDNFQVHVSAINQNDFQKVSLKREYDVSSISTDKIVEEIMGEPKFKEIASFVGQ